MLISTILQVPGELKKITDEDPDVSPLIVRYGKAEDKQQLFIVVERKVLFELQSFSQALVSLIALYFVFDLAYPKPCSNTLLFVQKMILKVSSSDKLSKCLLGTISDIKNSIDTIS